MTRRLTYGGWFEKKSPGLFKLTLFGTAGLFVGILLILVVQARTQSWIATLVLVAALTVFEALYGWKYDGKTLARRRSEKHNQKKRAKAGETDYITGVMNSLAGNYGGHPLPGVLADTEILHGRDGRNGDFAVIHYRSRGLFAVTLRCYPDGVGTTDQDDVDLMVAKFAAWLHDRVSPDDGLVGATVTIDTAPATGVDLEENVAGARHPNAPATASQIMDVLVDVLPANTSDLTGYVTLVWKRSAMGIETGNNDDVVVELAKRLPDHVDALAAAGAGDPEPMLEADLVETARLAYDPAHQDAFDRLRARNQAIELGWDDAGPAFLAETRETLQHDGGASFTLEMRTPPRGIVYENHLLRLLRPNPVFLRKRVTIFYQPVTIEKGQTTAESAVKAEDFTQAQKKGRRTATNRRDGRVAAALDDQLAEGASLVPFAMMATATYATPSNPALATDIERRARNTLKSLLTSSRMRVREVKGLQAPAFHMTLPFGIIPWEFTDNPLWK
ncbi:SCO6880 family protein [Leifsonia sp. NPDC102414]|uniref:SCO6880 family protein n=1 Tax=Leifsonia sp. NPDC102414 TaxID=3364124 RepID=UPI0037FBF4CD